MDVSRTKSRESGRGQEDEVVLFVPNAHCPSCVSHITTLLSPFTASSSSTPQLYDLSISYLTHKVSFRLAPTSSSTTSAPTPKRELFIQEVEGLIREAGFDVERIAPLVMLAPGGVRVRKETPRGVEHGGRAGEADTKGWVERWTGRVGRKERSRRERRRRHREVCEECQRDQVGEKGVAAEEQGVEEKMELSVSVEEPGRPRILETVFSVEGMFCGSCTGTIHTSLLTHSGIIRATVNLLANSATVVYDSNVIGTEAVKEVIEDTGYGAEVVESKGLEDGGELRKVQVDDAKDRKKVNLGGEDGERRMISRFAVGGMTCSACTTSISDLLSAHPYISATEVSVLTSSATVTHLASLPTDAIIEIIDDSGFECSFISSSPLLSPSADQTSAIATVSDRTINLLVDGMFCPQCVKKVNATLARLSSSSAIRSFTPITLTCPTTTLTYSPTQTTNVRTLLALFGPSLDPAFVSSLVKPPSITSRAREIQAREAKVLLRHFLVAFAFAIPTFVIAIVGMVLLPKTHPFRVYWTEPVWGGAGKGTVVLFVFATIVQFGVGRIFYQRAFRTLLPHLRRRRRVASGSTAPPLKRSFNWKSLFSFGSMDLLVVSSTTTAYFSSVAMMAVDVTSPREMMMGGGGSMMMGEEKMMTLFDASVFLIFFILAGRVLEAYAKTRTGDAVAMLGTLRPDTALLITSDAPTSPSSPTSDINHLSKMDTTSSSIDTKSPDSALPTGSASAGVGNVTTLSVPVDHLEINDLILVQPGSLPPTDGMIVRGTTTFDESSLTGESKPVKKAAGDEVLTGTVNLSGAIVVRVEKLGDETMIEKIVRAVSEAQGQKSPVEYLAEKVTGVFVPVVVYFAILVLIVWLSLTLSGRLSNAALRKGDNPSSGDRVFFAFEFFIAVLVVACPCGIGLAAPTAAAVGLGLAAQKGVLAQGGGTSFQAATKVDTVVFDKTGTLTLGKPSVTDHDLTSHPLSPSLVSPSAEKTAQPSFLLSAVRQMEEQSSHPLASALRSFCTDQLLAYPSIVTVTAGTTEEITGRGLKGVVVLSHPGSETPNTTFEVCIGNEAFMEEIGATTPEGTDVTQVEKWKNEAKSIVLVGVKALSGAGAGGYVVSARFAIADPPRPDAVQTVKALRESGKEVWMLSGDNDATAKAVAIQVGIDPLCVKASVLPEGKADHIRHLQKLPSFTPKSGSLGKRFVLFAGDGLNDSVALAAADVGVAMGSGSQVSVVSADFVLLNSNLESLTSLLDISRRVFTRTKVNFGWALVFNCVCLPLAAGVFYPAGGVKLAPVWSALAMALSSVSVVSSSLALRWGW